jgi:hypothetical protein
LSLEKPVLLTQSGVECERKGIRAGFGGIPDKA